MDDLYDRKDLEACATDSSKLDSAVPTMISVLKEENEKKQKKTL